MKNPPAGTWLSQIESARSVAELARLLRNYLEALDAEDRGRLPAGCTAEAISSAADIQEWAVTLAQEDLKSSSAAEGSQALHHAAVVFAAAGARVPKMAE